MRNLWWDQSKNHEGGRAHCKGMYHNVGGVEVDAQATGTSGEQEDEFLAALCIEAVNLRLTILS